jgi:hypothetical protein
MTTCSINSGAVNLMPVRSIHTGHQPQDDDTLDQQLHRPQDDDVLDPQWRCPG